MLTLNSHFCRQSWWATLLHLQNWSRFFLSVSSRQIQHASDEPLLVSPLFSDRNGSDGGDCNGGDGGDRNGGDGGDICVGSHLLT